MTTVLPLKLPFLALVVVIWNGSYFSAALGFLSPKIVGPLAIIFGLLWIFSGALKAIRKSIGKPDANPLRVEVACLIGGIFTVLGGIFIWGQFIP